MAINIKPSHKGDLHKALGMPMDKPISKKELMKHKNSMNPHMKKMIAFALASRKWKHG